MPESDYCYLLRTGTYDFEFTMGRCLTFGTIMMLKREDEISGMATKLLRERGISSIWLDLFSYNCELRL